MWVARKLTLGVLQRPAVPAPALSPAPCFSRLFSSVDTVRQLLDAHRRVPARAGGLDADDSSQCVSNAIQERENAVNTMVKELLRIFSRRVPGSLVPDSLVRGFMHAYMQLRGTQERLDFFRLVTRELGLSVPEVNNAVRLWDSAVGGGAAAMARELEPGAPKTQPQPMQWNVAYRAADRLASAATPLYSQLFVPISQAQDGMKFLVDLRADLMDVVAAAAVVAPAPVAAPPGAISGNSSRNSSSAGASAAASGPASPPLPWPPTAAAVPAAVVGQQGSTAAAAPRALLPTMSPEEAAHLRAMAEQLRQLLAEWFSVGLLHLQHISWEESPAALLERVMRVEAVHPLGGSWAELRRRLGPRRRVFAFTHPCMPGEPLVVLHTALMDRPASCIGDILAHHDADPETPLPAAGPYAAYAPASSPDSSAAAAAAASSSTSTTSSGPGSPSGPTTAVFYSISSSQPGLRGIELGHFLIQRVAERLTAEQPTLRQLVTLSPLPNFRAWLTSQLQQQQQQQQQQQPLLLPAEQVEVVGLARAMGWRPSGLYAAHAATTVPVSEPAVTEAAEAANALSWILDGDRWLSHGGSKGGAAAASRARGSSAPGDASAAATAAAAAAAAAMFSGPFAQPAQQPHQQPAAAAPQLRPQARTPATGAAAGPGADADADADTVLRPLLMRLAARYLVREKRRSFALCPVANFHLRNGASLWRINWRADMSELGLRRSLGIMCNYQYELGSVYDNNRRYLLQHEVMTHPQVQELLHDQP